MEFACSPCACVFSLDIDMYGKLTVDSKTAGVGSVTGKLTLVSPTLPLA